MMVIMIVEVMVVVEWPGPRVSVLILEFGEALFVTYLLLDSVG